MEKAGSRQASRQAKIRIKKRLSSYDYFFWWFLAVTLLFLALNKQLDLQSLFTVVGKEIAQAQGWYRNRRYVQTLFISGICAIAISFIIFMIAKVKFNRPSNLWAMVGIVVIFSFVIIRAASFHHVDRLIGLDLLGFKLNWLFELTGIAIIGYSARLRLTGKG